MRFDRTLLLVLALLSSSCRSLNFNDEDSYGLRLVTLRMTPEEYGLLNSQLVSKRPAQAEIRVAGEFKVQCHVNYAGRSSLDSYRKSYDLDFCDEKYQKRSHYRLSAQVIDKTLLRSLIGYELFKKSGVEAPRAEPATVYINKKYHGVYVFMETVDKEFFKARKIPIDELYKARFANAGFKIEFASKLPETFSYEGKGEDNFTYIEALFSILWKEPNDEIFQARIDKLLDIDSFLSYMAVAVYINHWDGFDNNYNLAFRQDSKKLITVPWDLDRIWEKPEEFVPETLIQRNELLSRLLKFPVYKKSFIDKIRKLSADYPAEKLTETMRGKQDASREAYAEDPILSRYRATAFEDFAQKIALWDLRIKDYLTRNAEL